MISKILLLSTGKNVAAIFLLVWKINTKSVFILQFQQWIGYDEIAITDLNISESKVNQMKLS